MDLNSLLFGLENAINAGCARAEDGACVREFTHRVKARRDAVDRYLWDESAGVYHDYQWVKGAQVPRVSAATLYPLFVALAAKPQAAAVARAVSRDLLKAGGIVATPLTSGQQWDAPNGWAPLEGVTMPCAASASVNERIAFAAPRILNEPVFWKLSHLKKNCAPAIRSSECEVRTGVR